MWAVVVTDDTSHFDRSPLKFFAPANITDMSVTDDTSHFDRSLLKDFAPMNMLLMSLTADTSHDPIGPCTPVEQSPTGGRLRHSEIAHFSSCEELGANPVVAGTGIRKCEFFG